jgi:hypothetical protein
MQQAATGHRRYGGLPNSIEQGKPEPLGVKPQPSPNPPPMKTLLSKLTIPSTVIAIIFLAKVLNPLLPDPDFYWHLKTGEYIASHLSIPKTDPFSYTAAGKPWVAHEWLTEIIFHGANRLLGFAGIRLLVASMLCATFIVLYRFARRMMKNDTRALLVSLLFFAPLMPYGSPRPQVFSFLLFVLLLCILLDYKYFRSSKGFVAIPFLMAAWANLHGAYVVGFALLALFTLTEWLVWRCVGEDGANARPDFRKLAMVMLASAIAVNFNPHGFGAWTHPFYLMSMEASKSMIAEWKSPDFHLLFYKYYLGLILGYFLFVAWCRRRPDLTELLLPLFFIAAGLVSQRHLPLTCFTLLAFTAALYPDMAWPASGPHRAMRSRRLARAAEKQMPAWAVGMLNLLTIVAAAVAVMSSDAVRKSDEQMNASLPVKATDYVLEHGLTGNMFNDYGAGGYLIYRLAPQRKVFVDGRADMYGDAFLKRYMEIVTGGPGWKEQFDSLNIDYAICAKSMALRQLLLASGSYTEAYADASYSVLVRKDAGSGTIAVASH